ncbi:MAG TPA: efflux RND transporter periplasmic adaptor subunit [Planctomycetota bacterium]|nr:efflux RND transporter periplasmic adaptor subunit [Planctomycetota bacterium]
MARSRPVASFVLIGALVLGAAGLAAWKHEALAADDRAALNRPEPTEAIELATAQTREDQRTTTSVGTVVALRSITLRTETAGTVADVALEAGQVVEPGTVLVALDVSVEKAELAAEQAEVALATSMLDRVERASRDQGVSAADVDRARAERDVAAARAARAQALIDKKTIRAPFRARVGLSNVHVGQYLDEGEELCSLQGVDDAVHVDFTVSQQVAAVLSEGSPVLVRSGDGPPVPASIVALDSRVDPKTRNAWARALVEGADRVPAPGASVRVDVPVGPPLQAVAIPVSALRKGPSGDHVFVAEKDAQQQLRVHVRAVQVGTVVGDEILVVSGLSPGERVATSGSFKLREGVLVAEAAAAPAAGGGTGQPGEPIAGAESPP